MSHSRNISEKIVIYISDYVHLLHSKCINMWLFLLDNYVWILSYFHAKNTTTKKLHPYQFFAQKYEIPENLNWSKNLSYKNVLL